MALVQYGAGVIQMSGSIAGDVHARNRFGNYIRPRTKPVNPHSPRQESVRALLSYLAEYWHGDMDAAERAAWEVYAAAVPMKNRLNATIHLTGYNHFMRSNCCGMTMSHGVDLNAPVILSLPEKDPDTVCSEEDIAGQTFTFTCNVAGWPGNGESNWGQALYMGLPQLPSRNFFAGPWRYMGYFNVAEGAAGTCTKDAAFPFGLGQKVWFQSRILTKSMRLSNSWTLTPRVIEADP